MTHHQRKRRYIVRNKPASQKPKNSPVINPKTGTPSFGSIPEIKIPRYFFPEGEIYLREGQHLGPNKGFGVQHIFTEHREELSELGYTTIKCVARFVSDVISSNAAIYCENPARERVTVLQSKIGVVIVEQRMDGQNNYYYSVVTAFASHRANGSLIGKIE